MDKLSLFYNDFFDPTFFGLKSLSTRFSDDAFKANMGRWKEVEEEGKKFYEQNFLSGYPIKAEGLKVEVEDGGIMVTYDLCDEKHQAHLSSYTNIPEDADEKTTTARLRKGNGVVIRIEKQKEAEEVPEEEDNKELHVEFK